MKWGPPLLVRRPAGDSRLIYLSLYYPATSPFGKATHLALQEAEGFFARIPVK